MGPIISKPYFSSALSNHILQFQLIELLFLHIKDDYVITSSSMATCTGEQHQQDDEMMQDVIHGCRNKIARTT